MLKPRDRAPLVKTGEDDAVCCEVGERIVVLTYQSAYEGDGDLTEMVLNRQEIEALREILTEDDPLSKLEVPVYELDDGVRLERRTNDYPGFPDVLWAIAKSGGCFAKDGRWRSDDPRGAEEIELCRWPTAEAALEFWEARQG